MGKLGVALDRQKESIKGIINRYLITLICVNAACILEIILEVTDFYSKNSNNGATQVVDYVFGFLAMFAVGCFFIESIFTEDGGNRKRLVLHYIVFAIVSAVFDFFGNNLDMFSEQGEDMFQKVMILYIILCLALAFHRLISASGMTFEKYVVNLVVGVIKIGTVLLLLNIGFILLITIFDVLIVDIKEWKFIGYVEIFLVGTVYAPYVLICLTDKTETESKFIKGLLLWVLMPMVTAAMIIIYVYMLKILVTGYMPKNEVFGICAQLFCYGVVIWTMAYPFVSNTYSDSKHGGLYRTIIKYAKYIYAPFILLECWAIGIRIHAYGVTIDRYWAVVFIILQIIYVAWEPIYGLVRKLFKKEKKGYAEGYEHLLYVGIAVYVLCVMLPFFSGEKVEFLSQKKRFEAFMSTYDSVYDLDSSANGDEMKQAASAYRVIYWNIYGEEYLKEKYSDAERAVMRTSFAKYNIGYDRQEWKDYQRDTHDAVSVSGYSYMYPFEVSNYDDEINIQTDSVTIVVDIKDIGNEEDIHDTINVKELLWSMIGSDLPITDDDGILPYEIVSESGRKYIIKRCHFEYNSEDKDIRDWFFKGYVLW